MTVMSERLLLKSKYIKMGGEEGVGGGSSFPHTATPRNCLPCGLTVIHLLLRGSSLWTLVDKIHIRRKSAAVAVAVAVVAQR